MLQLIIGAASFSFVAGGHVQIPLTDSIRAVVTEKQHGYPWEAVFSSGNDDAIQDAEMIESIQTFARQIQSKVNELERNLTSTLDEFEDVFASSFEVDWNVSTFDGVRWDPPLHVAKFNYSSFEGSAWLIDIEREAAIIESWQTEAEKLAVIAIEGFEALKADTTEAKEVTRRKTLVELITKASEFHHRIQSEHWEKSTAVESRRVQSANSPLLNTKTWTESGFVIEQEINSDEALKTITSLPLKTYRLKDDRQQDVAVSRTQRRTRYHIGPIDEFSEKLDASTIFSYNVGAVSGLAKYVDELTSKLLASAAFMDQSAMEDKVAHLKTITRDSDSFRTPAQLASEVAALETEAALKRITQFCHALVHSTKVNLVRARLTSRLKSLAANDASAEKMANIERAAVSSREMQAEDTNARLDMMLVYFDAIDQVQRLWNSTVRELQELKETARIESRVAREEINAEAEVERENEATSLEQIKLVGNALTQEIVQAVENIFWHLAGSLHHIVCTDEGRHQFLFYSVALASLVFVASTLKEGISLVCLFILRLFTAPRLVREYGNLRMRSTWWRYPREAEIVVLPDEIKDRMNVIVEVASAANLRGFPMRSILIYGQPGCGKSMVAKQLAKSTGLPYAMMSGGDVFPLRSQGPSELRRLLLWASRGRGGIIIIDEAECALGSRSKTAEHVADLTGGLSNDKSSSAGYSRDCLNVLLSMTGTFGNIMLILTTSNPSKLDEAVLDRMDEHIHLPLPSKYERYAILKNAFSKVFCPVQSASCGWPSLLSKSSASAKYNQNFNVESALSGIAQDSNTNGFSGRELTKLIQMIVYKCHASDSGVLDTTMWKRETKTLCESFAAKHLLKS